MRTTPGATLALSLTLTCDNAGTITHIMFACDNAGTITHKPRRCKQRCQGDETAIALTHKLRRCKQLRTDCLAELPNGANNCRSGNVAICELIVLLNCRNLVHVSSPAPGPLQLSRLKCRRAVCEGPEQQLLVPGRNPLQLAKGSACCRLKGQRVVCQGRLKDRRNLVHLASQHWATGCVYHLAHLSPPVADHRPTGVPVLVEGRSPGPSPSPPPRCPGPLQLYAEWCCPSATSPWPS